MPNQFPDNVSDRSIAWMPRQDLNRPHKVAFVRGYSSYVDGGCWEFPAYFDQAEKCPEAQRLMTHPGVGALTALAFVLIIGGELVAPHLPAYESSLLVTVCQLLK